MTMRDEGVLPRETGPRTFSVRLGLLAASAVLVLFVSGALLTVSLLSTRRIAEAVAAPLLEGAEQETAMELNTLFAPIRRQLVADYAAIRLGAFSASEDRVLKDVFVPRLAALPQVGSVMLGDTAGRQFLVMRYDEVAYNSPLLAAQHGVLPRPDPASPRFFTREVRTESWGQRSAWTLWSPDAMSVEARWDVPLPGYDPRNRPWHQAAMSRFKDIALTQAIADPMPLLAWTDAYTMFTTKTPGMSASIAAQDPSGQQLIVAYDLLLDEIAAFTARAAPGRDGQVFVMTEDGRLLGPPSLPGTVSEADRSASVLRPVEEASFAEVAQAVAAWRVRGAAAAGRWSMKIGGESWWVGFSEFIVGEGRRLWIGVLLPERDLVPEVQAGRDAIWRITAAALVVAAVLALLFARGFSEPVRGLAVQSRRITALDLEDQPIVRTRVAELHALAHALREMRRSLREHITRGEHARRELLEREAQVRTLAENTPDVVTRYHPDGTYAYANPALQAATGISPAEVVGKRIVDLPFPQDLKDFWLRALDQVLRSGQASQVEFAYPSPQGTRDFEARLAPERDSAGRIVSILVVSRDITERREAMQRQAELEAQLRQAQKLEAVGLLAGGVAHDFNNLLQVIGGSAALISPSALPQENAELLQAIREAVLRASQMTRQLLVFSRRQQPSLEALELTELVHAHLRMVRRMMPEGITITLDAADGPIRVMGDRGSLEQVLLNLCVNARDAMPAGGSIHVSLQTVDLAGRAFGQLPAGRYARLEVADTGHGIAPEIAERIFEPFFSTKPRDKGTGLGLSVVYGIVHQHEGHIEARNRAQGGAAFVLMLPLASADAAPSQPADRAVSRRGQGTILVAEDDAQVRTLATRVLERGGFVVIATADGAEAVRVFGDRWRSIDLVFLDILMPGMGGLETARRCRQVRADVPILFASGYAAESLTDRIEVSSTAQILQKPYDPETLLNAIHRLLDARPRDGGAAG